MTEKDNGGGVVVVDVGSDGEVDDDVVVDIECYVGGTNEPIVKELAICWTRKRTIHTFLFLAPYKWEQLPRRVRRQNEWLYRNRLGLAWTEGHVAYLDVEDCLAFGTKGARCLYAKGREKCRFLQKLTAIPVIDLESLDCPTMMKLEEQYTKESWTCMASHRKPLFCALYKCMSWASWLDINRRVIQNQSPVTS